MRLTRIFFLLAVVFTPAVFAYDHSYNNYDRLLKEIVVAREYQTDVDYTKLKTIQDKLKKYIAGIESVSETEFNNWDDRQRLAFLINAYNALTLQLINMHYPEIDSIRDLGGLIFSTPWDIKFFTLFGKEATLDHIEHDLIRKNFVEPRIHFAVNCASRGCPPLQPFAYLPEKLDEQLDYATRQFLQDPERNRYVAAKQKLELSSIFNWYKSDFDNSAGSIEKFVAPYITGDTEIRKLISHLGVSRSFLDYDWALNDVKTR